MENDRFWKKITATLFRPVEVAPSEAFVTRVMARIDDLEPARPWKGWLVPSFGAGFAALLFVLTILNQPELAAEDLLYANGVSESEDLIDVELEELP